MSLGRLQQSKPKHKHAHGTQPAIIAPILDTRPPTEGAHDDGLWAVRASALAWFAAAGLGTPPALPGSCLRVRQARVCLSRQRNVGQNAKLANGVAFDEHPSTCARVHLRDVRTSREAHARL